VQVKATLDEDWNLAKNQYTRTS